MNTVVSSLSTSLAPTALWGVVGDAVPFIAGSVLFGLGFYLIKRIVNKTKRAKGGI